MQSLCQLDLSKWLHDVFQVLHEIRAKPESLKKDYGGHRSDHFFL